MGYIIWVGCFPRVASRHGWFCAGRFVNLPKICTATAPASCSECSASGSKPASSRHLGKLDPVEGIRWEDAHWHDEVLWARDRQSRTFLALVGVHFDVSLVRRTGRTPSQERHRPLRVPQGPLARRRQAAR